ncbi:MAG: HAD family hydrolase [Firmicutes bacterium]|nr:HAD family hydrolase [Bacillota bacterium]
MALDLRSLADQTPGRPAVFLDRDGTISEEIGYIHDPAQYRLLPGAAAAITRLTKRKIPVSLVTNQSGPARGFYGEETVLAVLDEMHRQLAEEGAYLDAVYYCPHLPEGIVPAYAVDCECRKPRPGMLLRAAAEHNLDLVRSFMVGDKVSDVEVARRAGCRSILVLTGYGRSLWADRSLWGELVPDLVAADLTEAVDWILTRLAAEAG